MFYTKKNVELIHNLDIHEHYTRRKGDLHVQPCNIRVFKKSVINMGIQLYNRLLVRIKELEKLKDSKTNLMNFLLKHSLYSLEEYLRFNEYCI